MSHAALFLLLEAGFLAACFLLAGPPATVLGMLAVWAQLLVDGRVRSLGLLVPSLGWLVASAATGNRELFFPYAMYLAGFVSVRLAARAAWLAGLGGAAVVAAFLVIRILQAASWKVLFVESAAAAMILAVLVVVALRCRRGSPAEAAVVAAGSLAAYAALAL
jgi:hypothetical protein